MMCEIGKTCCNAVDSCRRKTVVIHAVNYANIFYNLRRNYCMDMQIERLCLFKGITKAKNFFILIRKILLIKENQLIMGRFLS